MENPSEIRRIMAGFCPLWDGSESALKPDCWDVLDACYARLWTWLTATTPQLEAARGSLRHRARQSTDHPTKTFQRAASGSTSIADLRKQYANPETTKISPRWRSLPSDEPMDRSLRGQLNKNAGTSRSRRVLERFGDNLLSRKLYNHYHWQCCV